MKIVSAKIAKGFDSQHVFYCPGCQMLHGFFVDHPNPDNKAHWKFNGDFEKPTFTPSLVINGSNKHSRCHLNVTKGKIKYHKDCFHELARQTIDLPDLPYWAR